MLKIIRIIFLLFCSIPLNSQAQGETTLKIKSLKAVKSNLAADAVGVNTHLNYLGSVYDLHYQDIIKPRLIELGTKHIRDHFGSEKINARYINLAHDHGIRLLLIGGDNGKDLEQSRNETIRLNQLIPGKSVVEFLEPANERDIGWNRDWLKLCSYITRFKTMFKENPVTKTIPLLGPSFANTRNSALDFAVVCKNAATKMDMGNLHAYSGLYPESPVGGGWGIGFNEAISRYKTISADQPIIETESGYKMSEGADGHPAVSERTAAKYAPRLVLSRLKADIPKIYFYQLINNSEDFGLLNTDGSPRLQYTALKNFISLMRDTNSDFEPETLEFSLTGNLGDIQYQLFQKSDRRLLLLIWRGVNGSEGGSKNNDYRDINNPELTIKLALKAKAKQVKIYRPSFNHMPDGNGTRPLKVYQNTAIMSIGIPDHIVCIEITK
ncbi:MAG: hypothetical protein H7223_14065 [Pedobacter sp.]|nr:hypothetical protein [Pedobacter sp.]